MRILKLFFTFVLLIIAPYCFAQGIVGSAHDFNGKAWNNTNEICVVCHTPHNANIDVANAPLWNHELSTSSYTVYTSPTLDATVGQPGESSKLCLSCHDGTVALENFGGVTSGNTYITGDALLGTDLSNDHPISFVYDAVLASVDLGLYDPTTTSSGIVNTIDDDMLFNSQMQCASCHDVHNASGFSDLLVKDNTNSALCLTCHNK